MAAIVCACVVAACGGSGSGPETSLPSGHAKLESIIEAEGLLHNDPLGTLKLFKSLGVAIEDVALAIRAYEKAVALGVGERLPNLSG